MDLIDIPATSYVERYVCCNCVKDRALSDLVSKNAVSEPCSYCGDESDQNPRAQFEVVFDRVMKTVEMYFGDATSLGVSWDDGFMLDQWYPDDVVDHIDPGWDPKLFEDIVSCLDHDIYWVPQAHGDWVLLNPEETLDSAWREFTKTVLHKTRYFFLSEPPDEYDLGRPDYIPVSAILDEIGIACSSNKLTSTIPAGRRLFRARAGKSKVLFSEFNDMGVAPISVTNAGRMNPSGIPYLYTAEDAKTSAIEIDQGRSYTISVAEFKTSEVLTVLDLVDLPDLPSAFQPDLYDQKHQLQFLYSFRSQIAMPVEKNGREHIEYVPTQIVSEYFRYVFKCDDKHIDGIRFRSSKEEGRVCLTLFVSDNGEARKILNLVSICKFESGDASNAES